MLFERLGLNVVYSSGGSLSSVDHCSTGNDWSVVV